MLLTNFNPVARRGFVFNIRSRGAICLSQPRREAGYFFQPGGTKVAARFVHILLLDKYVLGDTVTDL